MQRLQKTRHGWGNHSDHYYRYLHRLKEGSQRRRVDPRVLGVSEFVLLVLLQDAQCHEGSEQARYPSQLTCNHFIGYVVMSSQILKVGSRVRGKQTNKALLSPNLRP